MMRAYIAMEKTRGDQRDALVQAVDGLGAEVQRSGLLQALAFVHRGPTKEIAEQLSGTIREHLVELGHLEEAAGQTSFLVEVRDLPRAAYMRVTREIMALSVWLKRAGQILGQEK